jgi:rod shape-determining protein MreC
MVMVRRDTRNPRVTLGLLVMAAMTILTLDQRGFGPVHDARGAAGSAFSPLRSAASDVTHPLVDAWRGMWHYGDVQDDNDRLRRQVTELRSQADAGAQAQAQLAQITAAQDPGVTAAHPTTVARVSAGPLSNFDGTVQLDKGSDAGLTVGMPVVVGKALVGRVTQVDGGHSHVQLVTDPDARVGVVLTASGQQGTVAGHGPGQALTMGRDVPLGVAVPAGDQGDTAFTASGSRYPPDLEVGRVTKAGGSPDGLTQSIEVTPVADLGHLSYVTVILEPGR